ncbi:hypothetical protein DFAR_3990006 [Desulfarculales bacterium]
MAMLFCHLARADFLREICQGLSCCLGKLFHLGMGTTSKNPHCLTPTSTGYRPYSECWTTMTTCSAFYCSPSQGG